MSECFVATIDPSLAPKLREDLLSQGFSLSEAPYSFFSAKKQGISCVFYLSGKITVQGSKKADFITFYLEPEILHTISYGYETSLLNFSEKIGLDEAGKGDYFGPLCVAACHVKTEDAPKLLEFGIRDSKKLSDHTVLLLSKKIKALCSFKILKLFPETYNRLYAQFKNLNTLLAWAHSTVLQDLSSETHCKKALLDQFANPKLVESFLKKNNQTIDLEQRTKAESDLAVAAASILARAAFLEGLESLRQKFNLHLPKGASNIVEAGKIAVSQHGAEILSLIAKTHFKSTHEIL